MIGGLFILGLMVFAFYLSYLARSDQAGVESRRVYSAAQMVGMELYAEGEHLLDTTNSGLPGTGYVFYYSGALNEKTCPAAQEIIDLAQVRDVVCLYVYFQEGDIAVLQYTAESYSVYYDKEKGWQIAMSYLR